MVCVCVCGRLTLLQREEKEETQDINICLVFDRNHVHKCCIQDTLEYYIRLKWLPANKSVDSICYTLLAF